MYPLYPSRYTPAGAIPSVRENNPCGTHGQHDEHFDIFEFFNINLNTPTTHTVNDEDFDGNVHTPALFQLNPVHPPIHGHPYFDHFQSKYILTHTLIGNLIIILKFSTFSILSCGHVRTTYPSKWYTPVGRWCTPRVKTILAAPMGNMMNILIFLNFSILI